MHLYVILEPSRFLGKNFFPESFCYNLRVQTESNEFYGEIRNNRIIFFKLIHKCYNELNLGNLCIVL